MWPSGTHAWISISSTGSNNCHRLGLPALAPIEDIIDVEKKTPAHAMALVEGVLGIEQKTPAHGRYIARHSREGNPLSSAAGCVVIYPQTLHKIQPKSKV